LGHNDLVTRTPLLNQFGPLLKSLRQRKGVTLTELAEVSGVDGGNLSRMERGERKSPSLLRLLGILKALGVAEDSPEWHGLLGAAARDRFETLQYDRYTYLGWKNPLHGLPTQPTEPKQFSLTEAAMEIGRISASHGVKKITVKSADGSEWFFPIREEEGEPPQG
jgi:transcriptional regulator with XRE-family HTH domain